MTLHPGHIAATRPNHPAIIIGEETLSYGALDQASRAIAAHLHANDMSGGDVVAMLMGNSPAFFTVAWAAQRSGLYYLPIPTRLTVPEIAYILGDSGARVLVADTPNLAAAREATTDLPIAVIDAATLPTQPSAQREPPAIEGGDMLYTSGTTGKPKGVRKPLTGEPLGSDSRRVERANALFGFGDDTVFLSPAPLYHAAPLRFTMNLLRVGGTVVGMRKFDAADTLRLIAAHHVTHSQWVPTMFARLLALGATALRAHDLSSHRVAIHAGAPCAPEIKRSMIAWWGPILHEYYSGTESVGFTHVTSAEWLARPGTVGRAWGGDIHIVDADGRELGAGETGAVWFSGKGGVAYHGDDSKSAEANDPRDWATMGDIGHIDADGYLYLTDRQAFTIISGGVNIYPTEVEHALQTLDDVADCAVFGVPDRDLGEQVFAVIELANGLVGNAALAARIGEQLRTSLAGYKIPRRIAFASVGRTETGKLMKAELRRRFANGEGFRVQSSAVEAHA
jgi:long-chain acyl-CoA synthetase